jgi:HAD superfamily hydrolase (TIGR01484 family)
VQFAALATDYDGTLATEGVVQPEVVATLKQFVDAGHTLIMVTGRELEDLFRVFPEYTMFHRIVAENGGLLYRPETKEELVLTEPPSELLVDALKARGVGPISVGRSIIATWEPHEVAAIEAIKELGLELEVIFNKGAVMILPSGVNKSSGLSVALKELGISAEQVVAVGDAENDHAFLRDCGYSVAVKNALPSLKEKAAMVTKNERGFGVVELIEALFFNEITDLPEAV